VDPSITRRSPARRRGGAALAPRERRHEHRPFGTADRTAGVELLRFAEGTAFSDAGAHDLAAALALPRAAGVSPR
jgi:hypothetical protein